MFAIAKYWPDAAEVLLNHGAQVNAAGGNFSWSALMFAAYEGQRSTVEILLRHGADVRARDTQGRTALCLAAGKGKTSCVDLILSYGADPNQAGYDSLTPLMWVARGGVWTVARVLLKHGANMEVRDAWGRSALMHAAEGEHSVLSFLIGRGANLFAQDKSGNTALHYAAMAGKLTSVGDLLLAMQHQVGNKCDTKRTLIRNNKGESAADVADKNGNHEIAKVIRHFWATGRLPEEYDTDTQVIHA